jgi:hypothetical protein
MTTPKTKEAATITPEAHNAALEAVQDELDALRFQIEHPGLDTAFDAVANALRQRLTDMPSLAELTDFRLSYADGNHVAGWAGVIRLLEGVLGRPIRHH